MNHYNKCLLSPRNGSFEPLWIIEQGRQSPGLQPPLQLLMFPQRDATPWALQNSSPLHKVVLPRTGQGTRSDQTLSVPIWLFRFSKQSWSPESKFIMVCLVVSHCKFLNIEIMNQKMVLRVILRILRFGSSWLTLSESKNRQRSSRNGWWCYEATTRSNSTPGRKRF